MPGVRCVGVVFEDDEVFVAVSGEVHDVRTELGDAVQQVARGRGRADIEFDQVSVQRGLDGGSDTLLLSPDAQIAFGGRAEQQHPQLLGLGCTQFPERFADSMFRAVEARFGRRAFGGCAPISRGLLSLALPFRRVGLGALCSCELGLEVCFLLTVAGGLGLPLVRFASGGRGLRVTLRGPAQLRFLCRRALGLRRLLTCLVRLSTLLRLLVPVLTGLLLRVDALLALALQLPAVLL